MTSHPYVIDALWAALILVVVFVLLTSPIVGRIVMTLSRLFASRKARERRVGEVIPDLKKLVDELNSPLLQLVVKGESVEFRARAVADLEDAVVRVWTLRWAGNMSIYRAGYEVTSVSYGYGVPVQKQKALYDGPKWATRAVINQFSAIVFDAGVITTLVRSESLRDLFDSPELLQRFKELQEREVV